MTPEVREAILAAEIVMYMVADSFSEATLLHLAPTARSLLTFYRETHRRGQFYSQITQEVVDAVGDPPIHDVCLAVYGHPTLAADSPLDAARILEERGTSVRILTGVSSDACLFADLRIDPVRIGMQSYEATRFLNNKPQFEPTSGLLLWQVGVIGNWGWPPSVNPPSLQALTDVLTNVYGVGHDVILYEAPIFELARARMDRINVQTLPSAGLTTATTLYVPPLPRGTARSPQ
jgi:hypothetical protein